MQQLKSLCGFVASQSAWLSGTEPSCGRVWPNPYAGVLCLFWCLPVPVTLVCLCHGGSTSLPWHNRDVLGLLRLGSSGPICGLCGSFSKGWAQCLPLHKFQALLHPEEPPICVSCLLSMLHCPAQGLSPSVSAEQQADIWLHGGAGHYIIISISHYHNETQDGKQRAAVEQSLPDAASSFNTTLDRIAGRTAQRFCCSRATLHPFVERLS